MSAEPEWTERVEKRGLDPLGMQNAGVALYQSLVPGISNVTLRIRYYGYYCWVSDAYARNKASTDFSEWRSWVRRAEALFALVASYHGGEGGVGGVEWADRRLSLEEPEIDFAQAASIDPNVTRYLRQSLGVFGGAYYSQMVEVGLFVEGDHGIQRASNGLGVATAAAFREAIGEEVEAILIECIQSAKVTPQLLDELWPILPSEISEGSEELAIYEQLLLDPQGPDATVGDLSRTASLKLVLKTAKASSSRPDPMSVRWHLFSSQTFGDDELDRQRVRWEAYHCHDFMQIAAAVLLEWALVLMGEQDAGLTLAEIRGEVWERLGSGNAADEEWSTYQRRIDPETFDYQEAWSRLTGRRGTTEEKAWDAISAIAALFERVARDEDLGDVMRRELPGAGNARSILTEMNWFEDNAGEPVRDLITAYVVDRIVLRHSWVAMQKLRRQKDYTFLFEVRDGRLLRRNGYVPVATTPRLNPAIQFLVDVGLVDDEGLTERARELLGEAA
ncbi:MULTISPECIES: hypothetical protein [Rhizobium]|uniref:Uncharacterized protein n=1 Tax=Rhizobium phaseoli TaxID=396 RepID=A0A7X6F5A6_9HYPH|nr:MULTISPECIES: hypothetical protein [Rhizobium]MDE8762002.1 hypothetical protein [Rhizobium sp. CBK13]NKF13555.1 hypothetical protein [Rhizobium phaseoli]QPK10966.1 hypothetical protein HER27_010725 [Rhizobium phaseoli]